MSCFNFLKNNQKSSTDELLALFAILLFTSPVGWGIIIAEFILSKD